MVLRLEAEELTQYTDDLDTEAKRELLAAMLQSVDAVLVFFRGVRHQSTPCRAVCTLLPAFGHPISLPGFWHNDIRATSISAEAERHMSAASALTGCVKRFCGHRVYL